MMKRLYKYICICLLAGLVSCSDEEPLAGQTEGQKITATAIGSEGESVFSRLGYQDEQNGGVTITWAEGDKFYMKGSNGAYATMAIFDGIGEKKARFTGTLLGTMTDGESVTAYYPASAYDAENGCFNVDLRSITQDCTSGNEMNHLSETYFMIGSGNNYEGDVEVSFVGGTQVAMLRFDLTLPQQETSGLTIDELQIVCEDLKTVGALAANGTFTGDEPEESHRQKVLLENLSASTASETTFSVYVNVLPTKITGNMRLKAMLSDETVYWCDVDLTDVELKANNRYYLVRAFLEEQKVGVDYSWYDANNTPLEIENEAQLRALVHIVNGTYPKGELSNYDRFFGQTINLTNDIDLVVDWTPIGPYSGENKYFRGTFDGNGHRIKNLFYQDYGQTNTDIRAVGFFGATEGATIKNLTINGKIKSSKQRIGGIVGFNYHNSDNSSLIQNCRNEIDVISFNKGASSGSSWYGGNSYVGGIIGTAHYTSIINCSNLGTIENMKCSYGSFGGIVGAFRVISSSSYMIMACSNEGAIQTLDSENIAIGGIVGSFFINGSNIVGNMIANYNTAAKINENVNNCYVGGLFGKNYNAYVAMYGCYTLSNTLCLNGESNQKVTIDESCLILTQENKNSEVQAALLNAGILKWNTKEDGANGDATHAQYCNYHYEVGETHLIIKEGAPTASTETEEQ